MKRKPTPEQIAKAEERRERLRALWQKIGAMSEEERQAMAEKMPAVVTCEGHSLSANNTILLCFQIQSPSVVGGFKQWQKAGRQVRKGEHALGIWIPKDKEGTDEKLFFFGSVFDISQTEESASV